MRWIITSWVRPLSLASESVSDLLFFFSSRRRHTRCSRDWSSDVCSSDLQDRDPQFGYIRLRSTPESVSEVKVQTNSFSAEFRSEERRVGKECRSRWSP